MNELEVFHGGHPPEKGITRRVPNQRPGDGHIKADAFETPFTLTKQSLGCNAPKLKVGDKIFTHTTLTMGYLLRLGIEVVNPQEGLALKVISQEGVESVDLSKLNVKRNQWDDETETFVDSGGATADVLLDIGDKEEWISSSVSTMDALYVRNTDLIGFEIVAIPDSGLSEDFKMVVRLHQSQPARPPADLGCC